MPCNMAWSLSSVLNDANHLVQPIRGVVPFADLEQEIETGQRPVAARLTFSDINSSHFVVLIGCTETPDGKEWIKVADPSPVAGNVKTIAYDTLMNDYRPGALWDESYFTT